jgi:hypothetical protein
MHSQPSNPQRQADPTAVDVAPSHSPWRTREAFSILELGQAISFWVARYPTVQSALCKPASRLGDVLGMMFYERAVSVAVSRLDPYTHELLIGALHAINEVPTDRPSAVL